MIGVADQPLAERILRAAVARERPPQQYLFFGPPGTGKREAALDLAWALIAPGAPRGSDHLDLTVVAPPGHMIRLEDIDPALRDLHARPFVGERRVLVIEAAERLSEEHGAHRLLKVLEEPPVRSHVILVTDRVTSLLPTIRSRCLPVPFRTPPSASTAARLATLGIDEAAASALARGKGPSALRADAADLRLWQIGVGLADRLLVGRDVGPVAIAEIQDRMAEAVAGRESDELRRLREEAQSLEGKRGEKTAHKRVEEQERREIRRSMTDGWSEVLDGAASLVADAIAVAVGAERTVRHRDRLDDLRFAATPDRRLFLEIAAEEIARTKAEFELNPTVDLAALAMAVRIGAASRGEPVARPAGHLPF